MDTTPSSSDRAPESDEEAGTNAVVAVLGSDPWLRFDIWSARAWEATDAAVKVAVANTEALDESVDGRVMALFHSAQIAKEFSEMVNPMRAVTGPKSRMAAPSDARAQAIMSLIFDDED